MYVFVYTNSYIRIIYIIYIYIFMCVCIIDAFLPDDDDSLDIHLYFCYLCKCMHIKTNIYNISFNDCSSHSDMPPPPPTTRLL